MSDIKERFFPTLDVIAIACCIYRQRGFMSASKAVMSGTDALSNKDLLTWEIFPMLAPSEHILKFNPTDDDKEHAATIVKYYRKLMFGVIADSINDFSQGIFKNSQADTVNIQSFGFLACIPDSYYKDVFLKEITAQIEQCEKGYLGVVGNSVEANVLVLETKFIPSVSCWAHTAVSGTNHLVSFLNKNKLGSSRDIITITAKVKKHAEHFKTKVPETQLNYVKLVDRSMDWQ
jgi:hypothetical protein